MGGPGGLSLSLLSVLPTVLEEQVQYSRQSHHPLQYCIHKQQTLRYDDCVQTVKHLSQRQTPQDDAAPILFYKERCLTGMVQDPGVQELLMQPDMVSAAQGAASPGFPPALAVHSHTRQH